MTNKERRQIIDKAKAEGFQGNYVDLFKQADAQRGKPMVAETPQQKAEGLRPAHKAGNTNASMVFKDVPPHTPFNTVGMKAPISLKKYDERGDLVKSFDSIPPGIRGFDTGPGHGKVVEGPARAQKGKFRKAQGGTATQAATAVAAGKGEDSVGAEASPMGADALTTAGKVITYANPLGAAKFAFDSVVGFAKDRILENIQPYGYDQAAGARDPAGTINRLYHAVIGNEPEAYSIAGNREKGNKRSAQMKERTDLLAMNLGKEQPYGTIKESEYRPTVATDDDAVYYRSPVTEAYLKRQIMLGKNPETVAGVDYHESGSDNTLGNYTITLGEDEEGKYYSYYDVWDLNPFSDGNPVGAAIESAANFMIGNKPPEMYGRVYYKRKKLGGYRLPSYRK
jgi:hypothetical protein